MFTTASATSGEVLVVWGGVLFTAEQVAEGEARIHSYAVVENGLYLGSPAGDPESPDDLMNHSCDPNVWLADAVTLVARRDIPADQELTVDYTTFNEPHWVAPWTCNCATVLCRRKITGLDYQLRDLRERYSGHWSPFIRRLIASGK